MWWNRTSEEGCIAVAASDSAIRFHEIWSEERRATATGSGLLGDYSREKQILTMRARAEGIALEPSNIFARYIDGIRRGCATAILR